MRTPFIDINTITPKISYNCEQVPQLLSIVTCSYILKRVSLIFDSSIEFILHLIKILSMLINPLETENNVKSIFGWKNSTLFLPQGRKFTLTSKGPNKVKTRTLTEHICVVFKAI